MHGVVYTQLQFQLSNMGFLKRLIGSEPTRTILLGQFDMKWEHNLGKPKKEHKVETRFYLHSYATDAYRIEIVSIREVPSFSFFSDVTPRVENRLLDLECRPTEEEGGIAKFTLADLKVGMYGIVLLISRNNAVLIFPSKLTFGFTKA